MVIVNDVHCTVRAVGLRPGSRAGLARPASRFPRPQSSCSRPVEEFEPFGRLAGHRGEVGRDVPDRQFHGGRTSGVEPRLGVSRHDAVRITKFGTSLSIVLKRFLEPTARDWLQTKRLWIPSTLPRHTSLSEDATKMVLQPPAPLPRLPQHPKDEGS